MKIRKQIQSISSLLFLTVALITPSKGCPIESEEEKHHSHSYTKAFRYAFFGGSAIFGGTALVVGDLSSVVGTTTQLCSQESHAYDAETIAGESSSYSGFFRTIHDGHVVCQYNLASGNYARKEAYESFTGDPYFIYTTAYPRGWGKNIFVGCSLIASGCMLLGAATKEAYDTYCDNR